MSILQMFASDLRTLQRKTICANTHQQTIEETSGVQKIISESTRSGYTLSIVMVNHLQFGSSSEEAQEQTLQSIAVQQLAQITDCGSNK